MDKKALRRNAFALIRWVRNLKWPSLLCLAIALINLTVYLVLLMPMRHELTANHQQIVQQENGVSGNSQIGEKAPATELDLFNDFFPTESQAADSFEQIFASADKKGLVLKQADYRVTKSTSGEMISYQLTLPVHGSYPEIVGFVSLVLSSIQNLSLDNFIFEREKIADTQLDATLLFTLYLKREQ